MTQIIKKSVSILLAIIMVVGLFTIIPRIASAEIDENLVDKLATLYDGDEERARADLEALYASGLIDNEGAMVELDVREDGKSVDLAELADRINKGETVGAITVNGNAASAEQIVKISQMKAALEIVQLLDEEIDVTDEHIENLKSLLNGLADGSVDFERALKRGKLELAETGAGSGDELPDTSTGTGDLTLNSGGTSYIGPYISQSEYEEQHAFTLDDPANKAYYTDSNSNSGDFTTGGVITFEASTDNGATWTPLSNGDGISIVHNFWVAYVNGNLSGYKDPGSTPPPVLMRLTLNEPQPLPVSCDCMFSGGGYYAPSKVWRGSSSRYLAWDTDLHYYNQTISWGANQAGSKTFEMYPGYYLFDDKIHRGVVSYVFNAGNVKNATFGDGTGETWYATVDAASEKNNSDAAEATDATLTGAWAATGNYYPGQIIPIGVTFNKSVSVGANTTLTVNGVKCKPLCHTDMEGYRIPFGYTVTNDSPAQLNITAVNHIVNRNGQEVTVQPFDVKVITSDNGVRIINNNKRDTIDLENAKYGIDDGKPGEQVATVLIPLKGTDAQKAWLSTETVALPDDTQILMELPGYSAQQPITGYLAGGYFSYDLGKTRYPAYVVGEGSAIVARFAVPQNMYGTVRKDTVTLYLEKTPIPDTDTTYVPAFTRAQQDAKGFRYWSVNQTTAETLKGATFPYFVKNTLFFDQNAYIDRAAEYETAQKGFIKLKHPADPDFPYVLLNSIDPEHRYDVELLVTEDLYKGIAAGFIREDIEGDYRVTVQLSSRVNFTYTDVDSFEPYLGGSPNTERLTRDNDASFSAVYLPGTGTDLTVGFTVDNGGKSFTIETPTFSGVEAIGQFFYIPRSSKLRTTLTGIDSDLCYASNTYEKCDPAPKLYYTLYRIPEGDLGAFDEQNATEVGHGGPVEETPAKSSLTIPGALLTQPGAYAVSIRLEGTDKALGSPEGDFTYTDMAYLNVKQGPAKVSLTPLSSYFVSSDNIPAITYSLTSAASGATVKYTVQKAGSDEITEKAGSAAGGAIEFDPPVPSGLKDAYTITVYARNKADDPWSVDSLLLTVYNEDALKLLVSDVAPGKVGGTTGGVGDAATDTTMDNTDRIKALLQGEGPLVSYDDLDAFRADIGLQKVISVNYGSGVWGLISDKMQWNSSDYSKLEIKYEQGGYYSNLRNYLYTSYPPSSDFLLVGTGESGETPVTVTATHAKTGKSVTVNVTIDTLTNELYIFQFYPKTETSVYYKNGNGVERNLTTNSKGELVVYEPDGISGTINAMSKQNGETYVGTIPANRLVSGEKDIASLQVYPCNNYVMRPISRVTLTFLKPNGKPYSGTVTVRAGVYKNSIYCPDALVKTSGDQVTGENGRSDITINAVNGKATVWFDASQFKNAQSNEPLKASDNVSYVFEYRINGYQPGYTVLNFERRESGDSIVNLQSVRGSATAPQIIRQEYQQYYKGDRPTDYTRNVIDYTENLGVSPSFSKAVLSTDIALCGETVGAGDNGYTTYSGENVVRFAFYTTEGKKLTGQTDLTGENLTATQIVNLNRLKDASLFVFPFSSIPILRSIYTMTDDNLKADGITDKGSNPTPCANIKAVITRGGMTIRTMSMPFAVSNVSNQPDLSTGNGGAKEIGNEVRDDIKNTLDIGSIFKQIDVNDMIRNGFVFLSKLTGEAGDTPLNMMILPTQDPASFRIVIFVGESTREDEDTIDGGENIDINYNPNDLYEDISQLQEEFEESDDKEDSDSDGEGSMTFNFYGTIVLEARIGVGDGKWDVSFRGGNVGTNVEGKYEWGQTYFCGAVPVFISFETGFRADLEVSFGNKDEVRAMLLDAALGVSIEAFAGLGFDMSLVALQLGIYGNIGADVDFLLLTPSNASASTGTKLTISGEIGIKLKVKVLFVSYTKTFASTGFNWTKKWNNYDKIQQYWDDQGFAQIFGTTKRGRAYSMYLFPDGSSMVAIEGEGELESRDYLDMEERVWNFATSSQRSLLAKGNRSNSLTDVQTNAYPYSNPVFTDDGEMFLYLSDNNNADETQSVVSYAVKNAFGYEDQGKLDTSDEVLADSSLSASGTKDHAFAAWVKQIEQPRMGDTEVSNDDLAMMLNATEIYGSIYNGTAWTTERLTDNYNADMAPTVASCGDKAIVAWRSLIASSMTEGDDLTAMFNVENNINYRIYNGTSWTEAQVAYNGNAGTVNAIDSAMLSDGTALLTYSVRTGEDVTSSETFYTVIGTDGNILTTGRLTNDEYTDTNAQVTAVGDQFVIGWYSEHDAGMGTTAEYDEEGNATQKAVVAHDIRLARINANGSYDIDFPESIGGGSSADIGSDFHFSAPANNTSLENLSIVWSRRMDSDAAEDSGKYELNAVRFFQTDNVIGVTAPANIAQTDKNYTIDHFDAYTDESGAVHAIVVGSDYNAIEGIEVYDSIDLSTVSRELGQNESNSDEPNNLEILDGEAISSIKLATGAFPEVAAQVTADTDISEVIPGFTAPVQFTVTNTGTAPITQVTAEIGGQRSTYELPLLPNESSTLLATYDVPEGAVSDADYTVTVSGETVGSGTLTLNRPDVGISGMKLLRESDGTRDIQIKLSNSSEIPLEGSGKTVKLALYKDAAHKDMIGTETVVSDATELADIDAGIYTTVQTIDVTELYTGDEIPDEGLTVYAYAWVEDTEEPNTYNNADFISFKGLLTKRNGEQFTMDTTLEEKSEGGNTDYTVYADICNNSMQPVNIGFPDAVLLDSEGNELARKPLSDTFLKLGKEQRISDLSVSFTADEISGATPAQAIVSLTKIPYLYASYDEAEQKVVFEEREISVIDYDDVTVSTDWTTGWYVASRDYTAENRINVNGDVNLILCDGVTFNASKGIQLSGDSKLRVYGQTEGTGKLTASGYGNTASAIEGGAYNEVSGSFYLHGGEVEANGYATNTGLKVQNVTVYGGKLTASAKDGAGIGVRFNQEYNGTVTVYGGTVTASGEKGAGIGAGQLGKFNGTVTVYDGDVIVTSVSGAGIGAGDNERFSGTVIINGGTVTANSVGGAGIGAGEYGDFNGTVTINGGKLTASADDGAGIGTGKGNGRVFSGTVTINGGDVIAASQSGKGIGAGKSASDSGTVKLGAGVGLLDGSGRTLAAPADNEQTVTRRASTMKTGVAEVGDLEPVSYMESGTEKSCEEYTLFTDSTTELEGGWYVVSGTVTVPQRISVSGDVSIILCDDAQLIGGAGIDLTEGNTLSIYGQTEGSGKLSVTTEDHEKAAIGSTGYDNHPGTLNIYGGQIYAESEDYSVPAVGDLNSRDYGSLYFAGGKLVLANNHSGEALKVRTVTMANGIAMYQGNEPEPETTGERLGNIEIELGDFRRPYVTIMEKTSQGRWMYMGSSNGTITAMWQSDEPGDFRPEQRLMITANSGPVTGEPYTASYNSDWTLTAPTFTYYKLQDQNDLNSGVMLDGPPSEKGIYCVKAQVEDATTQKTFAIGYTVLTITGATITPRDYQAGNTTAEVTAVTFDNAELVMGVDYEVTDVFVENMAGNNVPVTLTVKLLKDDYFLASNRYRATMTINKIAYTGIREATLTFKAAEGEFTYLELPIDGRVISDIQITNDYSQYVSVQPYGGSYFGINTLAQIDSTDPMPITLHIVSSTYEDFDFTLNLVPTSKQIQEFDVMGIPEKISVGDTGSSLYTYIFNGNGTVSYSVAPGYEEYIDIDPATGAITAKKAGLAYFIVTASETDDYAETSKYRQVTLAEDPRQQQIITASDITATYGDVGLKLNASTNGNGTLRYMVKSGYDVLYVDDNGNITIRGAGTAVITITAEETDTFRSATKDVTVTINKGVYTGLKELTVPIGASQGSYRSVEMPFSYNDVRDAQVTNNYSNYISISAYSNYVYINTNAQIESTDPMTVTIRYTSDGYEDFDFTLILVPTTKQIPYLNVYAPESLEVGQTSDTMDISYGGDGTVSYSVLPGYEQYISIDSATGAITAKKAGAAYFCVTASETDNYAEYSLTKMITIVGGEPEPSHEAGYYIVGTMTDWEINDAYLLTKNTQADPTEFMFTELTLSANDQIKIVKYEPGEEMVWYPDGMDNSYEITADGNYDVYFRPNGDGGDEWFHNTIHVTPTAYTITWKNDDGSLIDTTQVGYGTVPTHDDPTKAEDDENTYTFSGWDPEVVAVTGDATYTAQFTAVPKEVKYTVTWKNYDGSVLKTDENVAAGTTPAYEGEIPTKPEDDENTYTFSGWTPEVVAVTSDATYTATFESTKRSYDITWKNDDGTVIDTTKVAYGTVPTHDDPVKAEDVENTYTFSGWDPEVVAVTGDATYTAQFTAVPKEVKYTVTWNNWNDELLKVDANVISGTIPSYDGETPTKAQDDEFTYTFAGWRIGDTIYPLDEDLPAVTGDVTYTATFTGTKRSYTITWKNDDGSVIDTSTVEYGETPVHDDPIKESYTFLGWDPAITSVTGDAEYTATYTATVNSYTVTWMNGDEVLKTVTVTDGVTPEYDGETPTKDADENNFYTFDGWTPSVDDATGNVTYSATFTAIAKIFIGHSITLGGNIGVNFYINSEAANFASAETAIVKFTWDDGKSEAEVDLRTLTLNDEGRYKATCDVVAAQMAHKIHAEIYLNGEKLNQVDDFSVQDYAERIYKNPEKYDDKNKPEQLKALAKALLNYGAQAQIVFDSALHEKPDPAKTVELVGQTDFSGVTVEKIQSAINAANPGKTASDLNAVAAELGAKFYTSSVIYLSKNTLRVYFTPVDGSMTMVNPDAYDGNLSKYYYYVDKANIAAAELDNLQEFKVGNTTFYFSALDYAKAVINSGKMSDTQKNLARSIYLYNAAANAYFD